MNDHSSIPAREELIIGPIVGQRIDGKYEEVPSEYYRDLMSRKKVGDSLIVRVSAPCMGYYKYMLTRMDATGVYGIMIENMVRELTVADVI